MDKKNGRTHSLRMYLLNIFMCTGLALKGLKDHYQSLGGFSAGRARLMLKIMVLPLGCLIVDVRVENRELRTENRFH